MLSQGNPSLVWCFNKTNRKKTPKDIVLYVPEVGFEFIFPVLAPVTLGSASPMIGSIWFVIVKCGCT
jgi:hypothetical protein